MEDAGCSGQHGRIYNVWNPGKAGEGKRVRSRQKVRWVDEIRKFAGVKAQQEERD